MRELAVSYARRARGRPDSRPAGAPTGAATYPFGADVAMDADPVAVPAGGEHGAVGRFPIVASTPRSHRRHRTCSFAVVASVAQFRELARTVATSTVAGRRSSAGAIPTDGPFGKRTTPCGRGTTRRAFGRTGRTGDALGPAIVIGCDVSGNDASSDSTRSMGVVHRRVADTYLSTLLHENCEAVHESRDRACAHGVAESVLIVKAGIRRRRRRLSAGCSRASRSRSSCR